MMSKEEALERINLLRSNIVATQSATWSNVLYPLVAILDDAGYALTRPTEEQLQDHINAYGKAGSMPQLHMKETMEPWRRALVNERYRKTDLVK